jgi:hypothetical protein
MLIGMMRLLVGSIRRAKVYKKGAESQYVKMAKRSSSEPVGNVISHANTSTQNTKSEAQLPRMDRSEMVSLACDEHHLSMRW